MNSPIYSITWIDGAIQIYVKPELANQFKQMVRRALNVWPDCHPALKEFGDMLEHGRILQDNYYAQRTDIKKPR